MKARINKCKKKEKKERNIGKEGKIKMEIKKKYIFSKDKTKQNKIEKCVKLERWISEAGKITERSW